MRALGDGCVNALMDDVDGVVQFGAGCRMGGILLSQMETGPYALAILIPEHQRYFLWAYSDCAGRIDLIHDLVSVLLAPDESNELPAGSGTQHVLQEPGREVV